MKRARWRRSRNKEPKQKRTSSVDMGLLVTEVATRLRCGSTVESAWQKTLEHHHFAVESAKCSGDEQVFAKDVRMGKGKGPSEVLDDEGVPVALLQILDMNWVQKRKKNVTPAVINSLAGTFAVCRMGKATGAPMAQILDSCAAGITEASEAASARKVAMAGPLTSARMLAALPLLGIVTGYVLGVDPIDFLLNSLIGNFALGFGILAEISGIVMVRRMVKLAVLHGDQL
ncbi:type II secretion system F family protein [Arcanobacterium ihumii]|uniref:type II secretion system F family protein n=1 Tax=Arcanobacterium ihumii TaxID=2138162 RepID=UPI000F53E1F4|nr:hypothetical protein [Arcanobacterium ihumii]